jgi:hypothetical protein
MRSLTALALSLVLVSCTTQRPAPRLAEHEESVSHDQPGQAAEYYAAKRGGTNDPHGRYARARTEMERMPRYSTSVDAIVTPGPRVRGDATNPGGIDRWLPLGPGNIGGRTRVLLFDANDPNIMYAGGVSGGLWKTYDAGRIWEPVADDLANLAINSLAMDPKNSNVLYAGTGEGYFREVVRGTGLPLRGNGIFVTRDGAQTWTHLASTANTADFHWVNDLVISAHDSRRLFAATRTGVWRSDDAGTTWRRTLDASNVQGGCLELAHRRDAAGDYLFASCGTFEQATVYRNKNAEGDAAWEPVLSEPNQGRTSLAIAPSNPSIVYAMAASNEPTAQRNQGLLAVYRSDASGDAGSWSATVTNQSADYLSTLLLTNPQTATLEQCRGVGNATNLFITMGWYTNTLAVDPTNPDRVWAAGVDLFRSDDGGRTFGVASYWWAHPAATSFAHADQHAIVFHPNYNGTTNRQMFAANDGGVYRTENPNAEVAKGPTGTCEVNRSKVEFVPLNHNYGVTQFYHGAVFPDGRRYLGGAQDNGTLLGEIETGTDGWTMRFGGDGAYVAVDPVDPKIVYSSYQGARIVKSTSNADQFNTAWIGLNDDFLFITPFILDPNQHTRLWTGGRSIWRSNDSATTWQRVSGQLPGTARVSAVAVAPGNPNLVLMGTNQGLIARSDAALAATATSAWPTVQPRAGWVSAIQFDAIDANVVYATYAGFGGKHVWKSTDAGLTWSSIDGALPDMPVHSIAIDPTRRDRLFLGTDLGVFVSTDGGTTWNVENTGFAAVVTEWVTIGQGSRGPAIYAFTHGRGAWRAELTPAGPRRRSTR